ncbi:MAG: exodeoxyribonuclease V subunit beta [Vibrio sp.]
MSQVLDSLTFPLHGARLIEASAGTGKTFTIASLYLRLLLGHGEDSTRHPYPLTVDQILVVTFTEAATAELKGRIRERIHQARLAFARGATDDPVLQDFLDQIPNHQTASQTLLMAERQMDEAAIFTIHGFCQRMLTQHAFESKAQFEQELVTDLTQLQWQVVCDFWRAQFYPLSKDLTELVHRIWSSPHGLYKSVSPYLTGPVPSFVQEAAQLEVNFKTAFEAQQSRVLELKKAWQAAGQDLYDCIDNSGINRRSYSKKNFPNWFNQVNDWAQTDAIDYSPELLARFSARVLAEKTNTAKGEIPTHAVFDAIDALLDNTPDFKNILTYQAIMSCRQRLSQMKLRQEQLSFDDLLLQLESALYQDETGAFSEKIANQYPVAMIDEFQDTDPAQYNIFSQIYLNRAHTAWMMIGDPKQAIYSFRGADIFTYIKARNEVSDHYTLGTNWRSSQGVIQGVNTLFEFDDNPFIYHENIEFLPVNASPNAEKMHWKIGEQIQPPIALWQLDGGEETKGMVTKGVYTHQMADSCAAQIHHILTQADARQAVFVDKKQTVKAIQASDIAVLVRTGREAKFVKESLAKLGIASVYLSNRDRVFDSPVATDLLRLLYAVSDPENSNDVRACLASELLSLDIQSLDALNQDELAWENIILEFTQYREVWRKRGVLPMIRQVISQRSLAQLWLSRLEGERLITDLMHLAEILQQASQSLETEQALIRWLYEQIYFQEQGLDEQTQRLESERDLVQIVTIHKSKGLEYDLVFLPFAMNFRLTKEAKFYDETAQTTRVDLTAQQDYLDLAQKERLAEDLRLLYVALTRAVYGCYIGVAPVVERFSKHKKESDVHQSALGAILQHHQAQPADALKDYVDELICKAAGSICPLEMLEMPETPYQAPDTPTVNLKAKTMRTQIERHWRMTSYSAIIKQASHHAASHVSADLKLDAIDSLLMEKPNFDIDCLDTLSSSAIAVDELSQLEPSLELQDQTQQGPSIFDFPRGAAPGTFLHTLFELVDFSDPRSAQNQQLIEEQLTLAQFDLSWTPVLMDLIADVLSQDLNGKGLKLTDKTPAQLLVEMEFLISIESMPAASLNQLIQQYDPLSKQAGSLDFATIRGMLKGFIDLVFEHEGKYYVLDWKSNHLGDTEQDYHRQALEQVMIAHRYDLQYQIYSLALHRYLKTRIPNYDYQTHFGGVYYLFLRGMTSSEQPHLNRDIDGKDKANHGVFFTLPDVELIEQLDALLSNQIKEIQ